MKRWQNILIQFTASTAQIANLWLPLVAEEHKGVVAAVLGTVQLGAAVIAHGYNPDGTPASLAYVKPEEPKKQ